MNPPVKLDTRSSLRRTLYAGYLSVLAAVLVFGGWAGLSSLSGAVIASATITAESYSKKVQSVDGGVISKILVRNGDEVKIGQDLIILDSTDAKAELGIAEGNLNELLVKRARLKAQRDGKTALDIPAEVANRVHLPDIAEIIAGQNKLLQSMIESDQGKLSQLRQQIDQLREQILGIEAQLVSNSEQVSLISGELEGLQILEAKGLVPKSRLLALQREAARLQGLDGQLRGGKATNLSQISEIEFRILQIDDDLRRATLEELRDTETKIAELKERHFALNNRLNRMIIKAPITGTIYQLAVHTEGGVAAPGESLMLIVPEGDELVLEAMVQPMDIDKLHTGQSARVRFPAFNARTTPEIGATVTQISADTTRVDPNLPPFYAIRLSISADELKKLGDNKLKPGMNAEVFIETEARSPLSYFLKPLMDAANHALRES